MSRTSQGWDAPRVYPKGSIAKVHSFAQSYTRRCTKTCDLWHAVMRLVSVSAFIISIACSSTVGPLQKFCKTFIRQPKSVWFLQASNKLVWSCAYKSLSGRKPTAHNNARCAWTGTWPKYTGMAMFMKTELSSGEKRRLIFTENDSVQTTRHETDENVLGPVFGPPYTC